eukprot:874138_1
MANNKDPNKVHWCGNKHSCPKECNNNGNCFVKTERGFEETQTYTAKSGIKIEYAPVAVAKAGRKRCSKKIAVGKFKHDPIKIGTNPSTKEEIFLNHKCAA